MSNSNKLFTYLVGAIFLVAGLGIVLEMFNIPFSSVVLLLFGILIWGLYFKLHNSMLKYLTCFLMPTGLTYFLIAVFGLSGTGNFLLIYSSLVCSFFCVYIISKKNIFLYVSLLIMLFALHTVTNYDKNMSEYIWGYDCFYVGVAATILFAFEYKRLRYMPLTVAVIAYLSGVLVFMNVLKLISPMFFKLSISLMFILVGTVIIIYNYIKSTKK